MASFHRSRERPDRGRFESADRGTLFLDEIGEITASTQVKLLRFLETKTGRNGSAGQVGAGCAPGGGDQSVARKWCVTNLSARTYFRLNVVRITLPPLRERTDDIPLLLGHFLKLFSAENELPPLVVDPAVMRHLQAYPWPGNCESCGNFAENVVVLQHG